MNADPEFVDLLHYHLAIKLEERVPRGARISRMWTDKEQQLWGSLVHPGPRVPFGLIPHVVGLAEHYGFDCKVVDSRDRPDASDPWGEVSMPWRPYQDKIFQRMCAESAGVVDCCPRGGKTAMAARYIDHLGLNTVYMAPSVQIVRQTFERFHEFWGDRVGRLDSAASKKHKDPSRQVIVTTPNSAVRMPPEWWETRDLMVIDECHHAATETAHKINQLAHSVYYRIGLTGTHFRSKEDRMAMTAVLGPALAVVSAVDLVPEYLAHPQVVFMRHRAEKIRGHYSNFPRVYKQGISALDSRNALVTTTAEQQLAEGRATIVLTRHRKHADLLAKMITGAVSVKGGENALTSRLVREFTEGAFDCLVGTTVIGEGIDVPRASSLIYASGGHGGVPMAQSYYRPLTVSPGKDFGRIFDFYDEHHPMLIGQTRTRLELARQMFGDNVSVTEGYVG